MEECKCENVLNSHIGDRSNYKRGKMSGGRWAVVITVSQRGLSVINSNINIYFKYMLNFYIYMVVNRIK